MSFFWYSTPMFMAGPSDEFTRLLANSESSLDLILETDEAISQAKRHNEALLNFFTPERLSQLVKYLIEDPPVDCSFDRGHKFPFAASELLSSGTPEMLDKLIADRSLLDQLFHFLDTQSLNLTSAAYFSNTACALLSKNPTLMYQYIFEGNQVPMKAVKHMYSRSIADFLFKVLFMDTTVSTHNLLERFAVLKEVVGCLGPSHTKEEQANASSILCDLIHQMEAKSWKLLICSLIQRDPLESIFLFAAKGTNSSASASLAVLNALLSCESLSELSEINLEKVLKVIQWAENPGEEEENYEADDQDSFIPVLMQYLPDVIGLLKGDQTDVGAVRLLVCELLDIILKQKSPVLESVIIKESGLRMATTLFFQCPLNSILQKTYEGLVHTVIEKGSIELQHHLLDEIELPNCLAKLALTAAGHPGNSGSCNIGYITRISNYLLSKKTDLTTLDSSVLWMEYTETVLTEVNEVEKQPVKKESSEEEPEFNVEDVMAAHTAEPDQEENGQDDEEEGEIGLDSLLSKTEPVHKSPAKSFSEHELKTLCRATDILESSESTSEFSSRNYWTPIIHTSELEELD